MNYHKANIIYNDKVYSIAKNDDPEFFTHLISANILLHTHTYWEGFYVTRGACSHIINNTTEKLLPGTLYLLKPFVEHSFGDKDEKNLLLHRDFCIGDSLFKKCCNMFDDNLYNRFILSPKKFFAIPLDKVEQDFLERRLDSFVMAQNGTDRNSLSHLFVSNLLQLFIENDTYIDSHYDETFNQIISLFKTKEVLYGGIPELASRSGYSHGHLCRLFKQHTGQTPLKILTDFRIQKAETLLTQTDFSILYISNEIGFPSLSHFISLFKQYYDLTPYQYRKKFNTLNKEPNPPPNIK